MAANGDTGFDMTAHERTYGSVMGLLKWGAVASFVIAAIVVVIIAS